MYLLCRLRELGYDVCVGHYNHGLRGAEADADELFVRDFCERESIPVLTERGDVAAYAAMHRMGTEEAARTMRYAFLDRAADAMGATVIATAHNAGDNAETMLLNLARGTGLKGLCGIPPVRGRVVRPMLNVTHQQAEEYLALHEIPHVEDATNAEDIYARNRVRHMAVPVLESVNPAFLRAAGQTATLLRQDEELLSSMAQSFVAEHGEGNTLPVTALCRQPMPIAARAVRIMTGQELAFVHVQAILKAAQDGGMADVPGLCVGREGDRLVFGISPPEPIRERVISVPGRTDIPEADLAVVTGNINGCLANVNTLCNIFQFKYANICGKITVAARASGDKMRPAGRGCTKTLKQLFQEAGVPAWRRQGVPVLRDELGIIAVYGIGVAERVAAMPGDTDVIKAEFIPL